MRCFRLGWILVLVGVLVTACRDNDELPGEPMRHMDSGLHMPNRDAATDAAADTDAGDDDAGDQDAGNTDAGQ